MSLSNNVTRGVTNDDGAPIRKSELVGSLVAFAVADYDPAEQTQYGTQPRVDVDLLVVDGALAGKRDERWRTWGALAAQMGAQPVGTTVVARVASGPGKAPGSRWYGLDFDSITDADLDAARRTIEGVSAAGSLRPEHRRAAAAVATGLGGTPVPDDDRPPF